MIQFRFAVPAGRTAAEEARRLCDVAEVGSVEILEWTAAFCARWNDGPVSGATVLSCGPKGKSVLALLEVRTDAAFLTPCRERDWRLIEAVRGIGVPPSVERADRPGGRIERPVR